jgi:large subunit ribosomal protein L17
MRHGKKVNHLGRTSSHRKAMLANMASSLIKHKRIITTVAKAKSLRIYVEPLITRSKEASTHNMRTVFAYLGDKVAVTELFTVVGEKVANRPGGYTRILKTGNRAGDNAEMAMIELVDFNTIYGVDQAAEAAKKTRRSRRSAGAKKATETTASPVAETPVEAPVETAPEATASTEATEESTEA